ncbi:MAG TPA: hypothetical protein VGR26_04720 [Acidimicrobiales bacterium]|nr:hypothetical protein [Acidimicrobiales bacterium]
MRMMIRAELVRLARRRTVMVGVLGALAFSAVATLAVFSSAGPSTGTGGPPPRGATTLDALTDHGGGTEAFAVGASFAGFLVFVTFIALLAGEFSAGTFRALLLRDPSRLRVIVGKVAGILLVTAAVVALAEAFSFALSLAMALVEGVPTTNWFSVDSVLAGVGDYASVLAGVTGWAVFGTTLAVVFRSVPVALGVGFAWAGPFENIIVDSWSTGYRVFPGQVLSALMQGGTVQLGISRAVATAAVYTGVAAALALFLVSRRDVTA